MTRGFDVEVVGEDAASAELVGMDIAGVSVLLRIPNGVARFDLEFAGRVFRSCALSSMPTKDSIPFTFESVKNIES